MQDLNAIRAFAAVVETGGFGTAARRLDMPIATVSRKVRALEDQMQVRLLDRTTRRVSLTEAGGAFYEHCAVALGEIEEAELALGVYQQAPRGVLRVSAPYTLTQMIIAPALTRFAASYPQVQIRLESRNDPADPVRDNLDLVIRVGPPEQDNVVARPLGGSVARLYRGTDHDADHPMPRTLAELAEARVGSYQSVEQRGRHRWQLVRPGARKPVTETVEIRPLVVTNDPNVLLRLAVDGTIIAPLPELLATPLVEQGRLVAVLPQWSLPPVRFYAVFASRRGLSSKVRAFVDFMVEEFAAVFHPRDR